MHLTSITDLQQKAAVIRKKIIDMLHKAQSGHLGPSMSCVELLTALYFSELKNLEHELSKDRDVFILSKGHAAPGLYVVLAERGLLDEKLLPTLRQIESPLQGHPERHRLASVDATTGSLGQGLSMAQGYALAFKTRNAPHRVYCIIGDGESQEGQIWEAAMSAPKFMLDNLVCIVDYNKYQNERSVEETMPVEPLNEKWKAFGWNVVDIDGHNFEEILEAFENARLTRRRPTVIIAHTVKSMGVSFMEGDPKWHSKSIDVETYQKAYSELNGD